MNSLPADHGQMEGLINRTIEVNANNSIRRLHYTLQSVPHDGPASQNPLKFDDARFYALRDKTLGVQKSIDKASRPCSDETLV